MKTEKNENFKPGGGGRYFRRLTLGEATAGGSEDVLLKEEPREWFADPEKLKIVIF